MNVYKRPMFLQGGGPPLPMAAPPMAAGAMAAPPMAAPPNAAAGAGIPPELQMALASAEQEGSAIGQGIGQKFVTDMMSGLEGAEDYEQAINAIRGNELPLSARYDELGEIVGEEDAKETPESVLALVQPAIMMTEEGAMNSGIGNLMQDLTGDIPMEGQMTEGVGSLMAAGQPAEPPMPPGPDPTALGPTLNGTPQGFAVGGAVTRFRGSPVVQNFQEGKHVTIAGSGNLNPLQKYLDYKKPEGFLEGDLKQAYEDRLKLYEKVGGRDPAADKAQFWAQMAQLGLNLAAPPPELRGRSPAEALAAAAKVPFANIAQLGARASEGKRATRFAALQAAETAETARKRQLATSELQREKGAITAATVLSGQQHERKLLGPESRQAFEGRMQVRKEAVQRELAVLAGKQDLASIDARGKLETERDNINNAQLMNRQELIGAQYMSRLEVKHGHEIMMARTAREQMSAFETATIGLKEKGLDLQKKAEDRLFRHGSARILQEEDRIKYQEDYRAAVLSGDEKKQADLVAWRMKQAEDTMASRDALAAYRTAVLNGDAKKEANIVAHRMNLLENALVDRNTLAEYRKAILAGNEQKQKDLISYQMRQAEIHQVDRNSLAEYRKLELDYKKQLLGYKQAALNLGAFGKSFKGNILRILTNTDNLTKYAKNTLNASDTADLNAAITFWAEKKPVFNPDSHRYEMMPGHRIPNEALLAMDARRKIKGAVTSTYDATIERTLGPGQPEDDAGRVSVLPAPADLTLTGPERPSAQVVTTVMPNVDAEPTPESFDSWQKTLESQTSNMATLMESKNLEDAFGSLDLIQQGVGWVTGHLYDWFNQKGAAATMARGPAEAGAIMGTVNQALVIGLRSIASQRLTQEMITKFEDTLPKPSKVKSDSDAALQFETTAAWLTTRRKTVENMLKQGGLGATMAGKLKMELMFYANWERIYGIGRDNLRGGTAEKGSMENAPTSIYTIGGPDYKLDKVPGYDPAEHKAFQDRGEDYRAYLTGN
jgi:hypothetical protein